MATSEFFQSFDPNHPENAEFVHYTRQLQGVRDTDIDPIVSALEQFGSTADDHQQLAIARALGHQLQRPHALSASLLRALEEFLRYFSDASVSDEEARAIAADLREVKIITEDDEAPAARLLERLMHVSAAMRMKYVTAETTRGYLPFCTSMDVTVELRAVYATSVDLEPVSHTPIASVFLAIDREGADAYFQIDRPGVEMILKKLQVAADRLRRLEELGKSLNPSSSNVSTRIA